VRRALVVGLLATAASAGAAPDDIVGRPLVLAPGEWQADLVIEINAAAGAIARPLSIAPDLWWGLTGDITLGLIHSDPSVDRIQPGASVCVRSGLLSCDQPYHGSGAELAWRVREGDLAVAAVARLLVRDLEPWKPAATLGARARWRHGRLAVTSAPYLQIGLANTDLGNRAAVVVPVALAVQPVRRWALELATGWNADLAVWRDGWRVPVALGVRVRAHDQLDVAFDYGFTSLLGPLNTPKERVMFVTFAWREP
jgi:hypothetical protein